MKVVRSKQKAIRCIDKITRCSQQIHFQAAYSEFQFHTRFVRRLAWKINTKSIVKSFSLPYLKLSR